MGGELFRMTGIYIIFGMRFILSFRKEHPFHHSVNDGHKFPLKKVSRKPSHGCADLFHIKPQPQSEPIRAAPEIRCGFCCAPLSAFKAAQTSEISLRCLSHNRSEPMLDNGAILQITCFFLCRVYFLEQCSQKCHKRPFQNLLTCGSIQCIIQTRWNIIWMEVLNYDDYSYA